MKQKNLHPQEFGMLNATQSDAALFVKQLSTSDLRIARRLAAIREQYVARNDKVGFSKLVGALNELTRIAFIQGERAGVAKLVSRSKSGVKLSE